MYAILATVTVPNGEPSQIVYGPYPSAEKAATVKLALGTRALASPVWRTAGVTLEVVPLVRCGLCDLMESAAKAGAA